VDPSERLIPALLGASGAVILAAGLLNRARRWRRRTPEEVERQRRLEVCRCGRITSGEIVDMIEPEPSHIGPRLILYRYEVTGAIYEAAQDVASLPEAAARARRMTGHVASVKYDPKQPANSIVVSEEWSGLPDLAPKPAAENPRVQSSARAIREP
jgi:hypothetical protein